MKIKFTSSKLTGITLARIIPRPGIAANRGLQRNLPYDYNLTLKTHLITFGFLSPISTWILP